MLLYNMLLGEICEGIDCPCLYRSLIKTCFMVRKRMHRACSRVANVNGASKCFGHTRVRNALKLLIVCSMWIRCCSRLAERWLQLISHSRSQRARVNALVLLYYIPRAASHTERASFCVVIHLQLQHRTGRITHSSMTSVKHCQQNAL